MDPRDKKSTKVLQLETAMGAAIQCFEGLCLERGWVCMDIKSCLTLQQKILVVDHLEEWPDS